MWSDIHISVNFLFILGVAIQTSFLSKLAQKQQFFQALQNIFRTSGFQHKLLR